MAGLRPPGAARPEQQRVGERVEADEYSKDDVRDFALWKGPREGEPSWTTAIGEGRPGWHIECSAMSMRYLGPSFDIHTGGIDLVFPHHEDEIAQSEAATGKPFVQTWLHCAHLQMGGQKMAKRTGNFAARPISTPTARLPAPCATRCWQPTTALRWTSPRIRWPPPRRRGAALDRAQQPRRLSRRMVPTTPLPGPLLDAAPAFEASLDDDLNIAPALAAVFELVRELNRRVDARTLSTADAARAAAALRDLDRVLGVAEEDGAAIRRCGGGALLDERAAARDGRDWARADALRQELARAGILVEDTRDGQRWRRQEAVRGLT